MQIGFIGLGKMGSRMVVKLLNEGHSVVAWNRSSDAISNLKFQISNSETKNKIEFAQTIEELIGKLEAPRVVWIMVPHQSVEEVLAEVRKFIEKGDIVIDGGNSNYKDTDGRFADFEKNGVLFLGIGVSGGIIAAENGYPMMVGGSRSAYEHIKPVLDSLSKPNGGHEYFDIGGAGHFVKMIHNGIEYAMMQAIGEGFEILEKSKYDLNLYKAGRVWQRGSIVSGFLIDRAAEVLKNDVKLSEFAGPISRSGEGDWTVETAKEEGIDPEVIDESVEFRKKSETDKEIQESFTARMINALRKAFGGHEVKQE